MNGLIPLREVSQFDEAWAAVAGSLGSDKALDLVTEAKQAAATGTESPLQALQRLFEAELWARWGRRYGSSGTGHGHGGG